MDGNKFARRIYEFKNLFRFGTFYANFRNVINEPSLYSDMPRKTRGERIRDNLVWLLKNHEVNRYYNSYGLDIRGFRNADDFMPYRKFSIQRNDTNLKKSGGSDYNGYNRVCILRDKALFSAFIAETVGAQYAVPVLAMTGRGTCSVYPGKTEDLKAYLQSRKGRKTILKKVSGECGDGVYLLEWVQDDPYVNHEKTTVDEFAERISESEYIVQDFVKQHEALNRINPSCVNTIRYVTIIDRNKKAKTFAHFLRVGAGGKINDNRATGGFAVNISEDGVLADIGLGHKSSVRVHPDTGFCFAGCRIPFWPEVRELAEKAHEQLPDIKSIGWDIAITPTGPVLIEGNDNWELSGPQDMEGGLKERWNRMMNA